MSSKDYILISAVIRDSRKDIGTLFGKLETKAVLDEFAIRIAKELVRDNPEFDVTSFLEACS